MKLLLTCSPGLESDKYSHLVVLDWDEKRIIDSICIKHEIYSSSHKGFSGGVLVDGTLVVSGEVELFQFQLKPLKLIRRTSSEILNDVHFVGFHDEYYFVCNSGLDSLEVFDQDFNHRETITLIDKLGLQLPHLKQLFRDDIQRWLHRKSGKFTYYRHLQERFWFKNVKKIISPLYFHKSNKDLRFYDFRPHFLHPNHCISVKQDLWITLWRPGVVFSLSEDKVVVSEQGWPDYGFHDGTLFGSEFFLTDASNNRLLIYEFDDHGVQPVRKRVEKYVTNTRQEGFLRGVAINKNSIYLGLSARRNSPDWDFARVLEISKDTLDFQTEWHLPNQYGKQIYSVINVSDIY